MICPCATALHGVPWCYQECWGLLVQQCQEWHSDFVITYIIYSTVHNSKSSVNILTENTVRLLNICEQTFNVQKDAIVGYDI